MNDTKIQGKTRNLNEAHRSDGTEMIPAEVQLNIRRDEPESVDNPATTGYTTDDEGLTNNYGIEPDVYGAEYPSPRQQQRYLFLGAGATLFVVILLLITFATR